MAPQPLAPYPHEQNKTIEMRKPKSRNNNSETEAAYFGKLRSALRRHYRGWKPMMEAKKLSRVPYVGDNPRMKWLYQCNACKSYFKGTEVQVDHITPVGTLRCLEDLPAFVERLCCEEVEAFQVLCLPCHQEKTNLEREKK